MSFPQIPARILASAKYKAQGTDHTLTLWDVPLHDENVNGFSPETTIKVPWGASPFRIRCVYLVDSMGTQRRGKLLMLAYWRHGPFSSMVANIFTGPDGRLFVIMGDSDGPSELEWQVYAVDKQRVRRHTRLSWDRFDKNLWPAEDKMFDAVNVVIGLSRVSGLRTDADDNGNPRLHLILNDSERDSVNRTPDREIPTYWRLDLKQHKWSVVAGDGTETEMKGGPEPYPFVRFYEDNPDQQKSSGGAAKK